MKKIISLFLIVSLVALFGCSSNPVTPNQVANQAENTNNEVANTDKKAETKNMKIAMGAPKDHPVSKGAYKFAELVEQETGGSVKVQVFTDGTLGSDLQMADALQAGTLDASVIATAPLSGRLSQVTIFEMPFLFKDRETAFTVLDGEIGKEVLKDMESIGMIGLSYFENGYRNLTNSKKEVKTVADLQGLKVRTQENSLHLDTWKALGAVPTPIAFTELFTALEQQVIDGQENPYTNIRYANVYEVQKYLTNTNHMYNILAVAISNKFWSTLSEDEKQAVQKAADQAAEYQRELNKQELEESLQFLVDNGMIVTELTPEARQEFVDKMQPVYDKYKGEIGEDLFNRVMDAIK